MDQTFETKIIKIYVTPSGEAPFRKWFDSLDYSIRIRLDNRLLRLTQGNFGDCASVGEGVFELRFFFGSGFRIYFAEYGGCFIFLLYGGDKHIQSRDIQKAKEYWRQFKESIQ